VAEEAAADDLALAQAGDLGPLDGALVAPPRRLVDLVELDVGAMFGGHVSPRS
jgi:hypothetical protein